MRSEHLRSIPERSKIRISTQVRKSKLHRRGSARTLRSHDELILRQSIYSFRIPVSILHSREITSQTRLLRRLRNARCRSEQPPVLPISSKKGGIQRAHQAWWSFTSGSRLNFPEMSLEMILLSVNLRNFPFGVRCNVKDRCLSGVGLQYHSRTHENSHLNNTLKIHLHICGESCFLFRIRYSRRAHNGIVKQDHR